MHTTRMLPSQTRPTLFGGYFRFEQRVADGDRSYLVYGIGHDVGNYRVFPTAILRKRPSRRFRSSTKMLVACCLRVLVACCPLDLFVISLTLCPADGMIRLYRNYDPATSSTDVQMVSAFRGLSEIISMRRGAGVVVDWKQAGGFLLVGGDSHIIRVWDAHTEAQLLVREQSTLPAKQTLRNIHRILKPTLIVRSRLSPPNEARPPFCWLALPMALSKCSIDGWKRRMPLCDHSTNILTGSRTSVGIPNSGISSCQRG